MLKAIFTDGVDEITVHGLTQWDRGQTLQITLSSLSASFQVHFANKRDDTAHVVEATASGGVATVAIPDAILQKCSWAVAWIYLTDSNSGETIKTINLPIKSRAKPGGYAITESEILDYKTLDRRIDALEKGGAGGLDSTASALLITILRNAVFSSDQSANITALEAALASSGSGDSGNSGGEETPDEPDDPEVTLSSISATYSGGDVAVGTAVTDLTGIVVTAHYSDGSTATVTYYYLADTVIVKGSNTIIVSYRDKTTAFTVTGVVEAVYVYSLELGNMLLHMGGHGMAYNTIEFQALSGARITPYIDSGVNAGYYRPDTSDKTHFPFPIPADATGVTVTIEPSGYYTAPAFLTMTEAGYTRDVDAGWQLLSTGQWSYSFDAGAYTHFFTGTKTATGGNFPENPFTTYKIEFTK